MNVISRRTALKSLGLGTIALVGGGGRAALANGGSNAAATQPPAAATGPFQLPPLPYAYDALEPAIDKLTMEIHHDRHHLAYVTNLNKAIAGNEGLSTRSVDDLLTGLETVPEAIRQIIDRSRQDFATP